MGSTFIKYLIIFVLGFVSHIVAYKLGISFFEVYVFVCIVFTLGYLAKVLSD